MVEETNGFVTDAVLAPSDLMSVSDGTNILVLGSEIDTARVFANQLLALASQYDENALVISTDGQVDEIVETLGGPSTDGEAADLTIIDCSGNAEGDDDRKTHTTMSVESPGNLTDLGMAFIEYEDKHGDDTSGTRVMFDSISTLFEHLEEDRVFEFIAAFKGRIHTSEHLGLWVMDTSETSDASISTFTELFDIVLEVRDIGGTLQYRTRGENDDWMTIPQS